MHFYYIDESGCTGRDLNSAEQPIFVSGGIILRDEGWNKTHQDYQRIISTYFGNAIPNNFELHTQDLFSTNGTGHFLNHSRARRSLLINEVLDLVIERRHQYFYCAIDKSDLSAYNTTTVRDRSYCDLMTPYLIAYDYLITVCEKYTRDRLGQSARALVIIDEKDAFINEIESITNYRRFSGPVGKRIKWISEFSYPVDSRKNSMIQISDLMLFLTRKYLEIEAGYKDTWSAEVKNIFRDFYRKIHDQLVYASIQQEDGRNSEYYNEFISSVCVLPSTRWRTKVYQDPNN